MDETVAPSDFTEIIADLSAYEGQQGYIAIRHFNSYDNFILKVDDFGIYENAGPSEWTTVNNIGNNTLVLNGLRPETDYEWQVQGISDLCEGGVTDWSESAFFTTANGTTQTVVLSAGTNWWSTNLDITLEDLQAVLVEALPGTTNIVIQSKAQSTTYNGSRWRGQLSALDVANMYKITVTADCEITLTGMPINPAEHPVSIPAGQIVWIGFPFSEGMTPADAFAGFAVSGDEVSSKSQSTAYNGTRWRGQLNSLEPGKGYIYKSAATEDRTFTYPAR